MSWWRDWSCKFFTYLRHYCTSWLILTKVQITLCPFWVVIFNGINYKSGKNQGVGYFMHLNLNLKRKQKTP